MKLAATGLMLIVLLVGCSTEETLPVEDDVDYEEVTVEDTSNNEEAISFEEQAEIVKSMESQGKEMITIDALMVGYEKLDMTSNKYRYTDLETQSYLIVQMNSEENYVENVQYTIIDADGNVKIIE